MRDSTFLHNTCIAIAVLLIPALTYAQDEGEQFKALFEPTDPIPVVYVGSYHMGNPGADMFNLEADDVLAPKRQEEIRTVVDQLAKFRPTKIAVEAPYGDSATLARYRAYVAGERELRRSEEEQIGFRLAHQLGHKAIYPIDMRMGMDDSGVRQLVQENPQKFGPYFADLEKAGKAALEMMGKWLSEGTIGSMLYKMNDPLMEQLSHEIYFRCFVPIVTGDSYAGADMISSWYQRNLRIFSNLHKITDSPDDRILVVYGQGHVYLLKQFTEESPFFMVEDVRGYLEEE